MRLRVVLYNLGKIDLVLAVSMILPIICSLIYKEGDFLPLLASMAIMAAAGGSLMFAFKDQKDVTSRYREGFALVSFAWISAGILGALPYFLSGVCPNFVDGFFESMAGFTTTGSSILTNVEVVPKGVMMWRALTHWLGGMGIVVLLLALAASKSGNKLYKAEAPGNSLSAKLTPKIGDSSKILWFTYLILSVVLFILLKLGGMTVFDAITHTFGTVSTGGFSSHNLSVGQYNDNAFIQWVITIFMLASGINFAYYYVSLTDRKLAFLRSEEFRVYGCIVLAAITLIMWNLLSVNFYDGESLEYILRQVAFQVATIITTTGFATTDFNLWPDFSKMVLFSMFFIGGCVGSTSGSIKVARIVIAVKACFASFSKALQPKLVHSIKLEKKSLPPDTTNTVMIFLVIYAFLMFLGSLVMAFQGLTMIEAISTTAACLCNVGPAFDTFGPTGNYSTISNFGKIFLSIYMMLGRLELFTVLVLFSKSMWRK